MSNTRPGKDTVTATMALGKCEGWHKYLEFKIFFNLGFIASPSDKDFPHGY